MSATDSRFHRQSRNSAIRFKMVRCTTRFFHFSAACALAIVCHSHAEAAPRSEPDPAPFAPAAVAGVILDSRLAEISGLIASRRHPEVLWAVNDGGNPAAILAMSHTGETQAAITIDGADNIDWEDLGGFTRANHHYLLIADTGDNGGARRSLELLLVEEPSQVVDGQVPLLRKLTFRWPDGARDCEAIAVDSTRGEILLLSKKRVPAQLFRLPLDALFRKGVVAPIVAEEIATLPAIPQPSAAELARDPRFGRFRAQITGMALRDDGALAVQAYRDTYLYQANTGREWRSMFRAPPRALGVTFLPQAEAVTFDPVTGDIFVASERLPSPLVRLRAKGPWKIAAARQP